MNQIEYLESRVLELEKCLNNVEPLLKAKNQALIDLASEFMRTPGCIELLLEKRNVD